MVDEGEVEGEPQQQVVVVGTNESAVHNNSEAVKMGQVLLQVVELVVEFFADSQISVDLLGWTLLNGQVEAEG